MLHDVDHMEARYIFYVKVGTFDQLEQIKICILPITTLEVVMLIVPHDLIVNICFMYDAGDVLRQTSPDVVSVEECPFNMYQT